MRYKLLGRSGLRVSELCLGAMTFGSDEAWCADKAESRAMFDAYVEAGGNFIDTADVYTQGESERLVGEFVASDRERFVVATKYTNAFPGPNDARRIGGGGKMRGPFSLGSWVSLLLVVTGPALPARAEVVDATWIGATGNWNVSENWDIGHWPNNEDGNNYNIFIDGGDVVTESLVYVNIPAIRIDNLARVRR